MKIGDLVICLASFTECAQWNSFPVFPVKDKIYTIAGLYKGGIGLMFEEIPSYGKSWNAIEFRIIEHNEEAIEELTQIEQEI